ncbi:ATP-binding cassette domain-containing protein [Chitinophaga pendula]|uniref:ABC transporter ATP-binding protein n=1 Tax=Chitinophaga TaxID=79328 RepID=UPI000BB04B23|nr:MULTISPECIES: ATP-binding cassette domain-containing protein [Chitinophaga]ASZ11603.1 ABC transporter [Chitinophaga sp. MD30]UCJ05387.1 ATP-binding cassette domain-containing protein [Chitinophaga pendula]
MSAILLKDIKKYYGDTLALDIGHLSLDEGIYWVQGGNGAGKTTWLKVMAGLLSFRGEILLQGAVSSLHHPVAYRRKVNYGEAEPLYPGFLTGRELLRLYLSTKGGDADRILELGAAMGVNDFLLRPVSTYSSGMLKKLSLLLSFTGVPSLILLDEPLITLDVQTIPLLYDMIREWREEYGVTFCITSHQVIAETEFAVNGTLLVENRQVRIIG